MTAVRKTAGKLRQAERRAQILLELQIAPHVRIVDLVSRFTVTTETVRRDLDALDAQGRLARSHGGAVGRIEAINALYVQRAARGFGSSEKFSDDPRVFQD